MVESHSGSMTDFEEPYLKSRDWSRYCIGCANTMPLKPPASQVAPDRQSQLKDLQF